LYLAHYPAVSPLYTYFLSLTGIPPEHNVVKLNICVGSNFLGFSSDALPYIGVMSNSVGTGNPGFINSTNYLAGMFQLNTNSQIYNMGFRQIPFSSIGTNATIPLTLMPPNSLQVH
jgi:hypothetical protein